MEKIPKHLPEIQKERNELAQNVKELRGKRGEKLKEAATIQSKAREFLGMKNGSQDLQMDAHTLKSRILEKYAQGKRSIKTLESETLRRNIIDPLTILSRKAPHHLSEKEATNLIEYFIAHENEYAIALNQADNSAIVISKIQEALSAIPEEEKEIRQIFSKFLLKHYSLIVKQIEQPSGYDSVTKIVNFNNSISTLLQISKEATGDQKDQIIADMIRNLPLIAQSLENRVSNGVDALVFLLSHPWLTLVHEKIWKFVDEKFENLDQTAQNITEGILYKSKDENSQKKMHQIVQKKMLADFGFSFDTQLSWQDALDIFQNLRFMHILEKKRPGISLFLNEKFGIMEYARYPEELLVRQYDEYDNVEKPYGIIIYPTADHNRAFDQNRETFAQLNQDIKDSYALRVFECTSKTDIGRAFISLDDRYGQHNKISFAILGGHGGFMGQAMVFGISDDGRGALLKNMIEKPAIKKLKNYFIPNPSIILASCSTGSDIGLAQKISQEFPEANIWAPAIDTALNALPVTMTDNGIELRAEYNHAEVERHYRNGVKL